MLLLLLLTMLMVNDVATHGGGCIIETSDAYVATPTPRRNQLKVGPHRQRRAKTDRHTGKRTGTDVHTRIDRQTARADCCHWRVSLIHNGIYAAALIDV